MVTALKLQIVSWGFPQSSDFHNNKVIMTWCTNIYVSSSLPERNYLFGFGLGINRWLDLCLQAPKISSLLLRLDWWEFDKMQYFSRVQRLHTPVIGLKGEALPIIFQSNLYGICLLLRSHTLKRITCKLSALWFFHSSNINVKRSL